MINVIGIMKNGEIISANSEGENISKIISSIAANNIVKLIFTSSEGEIEELNKQFLQNETNLISVCSAYCKIPDNSGEINIFIINILWGAFMEMKKDKTIAIG